MKKFFITALCVCVLAVVISASMAGDDQKSNKPAKVENTVKKAEPAKATQASCCAADKKESCTAKACAQSSCAEKKTCPVAASCTNKVAAKETKSSGKK